MTTASQHQMPPPAILGPNTDEVALSLQNRNATRAIQEQMNALSSELNKVKNREVGDTIINITEQVQKTVPPYWFVEWQDSALGSLPADSNFAPTAAGYRSFFLPSVAGELGSWQTTGGFAGTGRIIRARMRVANSGPQVTLNYSMSVNVPIWATGGSVIFGLRVADVLEVSATVATLGGMPLQGNVSLPGGTTYIGFYAYVTNNGTVPMFQASLMMAPIDGKQVVFAPA